MIYQRTLPMGGVWVDYNYSNTNVVMQLEETYSDHGANS
jgi:hypothetical protein